MAADAADGAEMTRLQEVSDLVGAQVLVTGARVTGLSAARFLAELGAQVTVTDSSAGQLQALAATPLNDAVQLVPALHAPPPGTDLVVTSPGLRPDTPVLVAEPVAFLAEFRCFVREGSVVATSPYLSFGKPVWKPWGQGGEKMVPSMDAVAVCWRLFDGRLALPPAFVVDVGLA